MTPAEFLKTVWPDTGLYAIATPFKPADAAAVRWSHKVFQSIDDAAVFAAAQAHRANIFFAVATLKHEKIWNPTKDNWKTGEKGAFEIRTQANSKSLRCLFMDLDVGADSPNKYPTQAAALEALRAFCKATGLPKPLVVSSGGGLHVYFLLDTPLEAAEWRVQAAKLRALAKHHGLRLDPSRTTDSASVLRVAGTFNLKGEAPREVRVLLMGVRTGTTAFIALLGAAMIRADVSPATTNPRKVIDLGPLGSNLEKTYDGPPVTIRALLTACKQMQNYARTKGDVSEPEWYHAINLIRFVEDGRTWVHRLSTGASSYDPDKTDAKISQLEGKDIGPTTCAKLVEVCGEDACATCPFAGKVASPIVAARYKDEAPAPKVEVVAGNTTITVEVPPPPAPFIRKKGGGIAFKAKDEDGDEGYTDIYENDLYPVKRVVNAGTKTEQQVWRVTLPREGAKDFILDADALYDRKKFLSSISNNGIYPHPANVAYLQEYMVAYIAHLQRLADAEAQCNHLGWSDDLTNFILPDKVLLPNGKAKSVALGLGASRASAAVHKKGTKEKQIELLRFYSQPAYVSTQFMILCSLGAPIYHATGHHGSVVGTHGPPGKGKSLSLYTAASLWGHPKMYPINGTNNGATMRGRNERISVLANLPICVDEITHMPVKEAIDLAMGISQPGHRIRLSSDGTEKAGPDSYKATIMLTTANTSLHGMLSMENAAGTAGSMRVFEMQMKGDPPNKKHEADDFLSELTENYGHIGEAFMEYVVQHHAEVVARVRELVREIDAAANIQPSERFWSATVAAAIAAGEVAQKVGLVNYDLQAILDWAIEYQIPSMRGAVEEQHVTPVGMLADFLQIIAPQTVFMGAPTKAGMTPNISGGTEDRPVFARYEPGAEVMYVMTKAFRDYCARTGANSAKILEDLNENRICEDGKARRVVLERNTRKVLGVHEGHSKAQVRCFTVNMNHPAVSGMVSDEGRPPPAPVEMKPSLKLVKG